VSWLLDTNVVSELRKPGADPAVVSWANQFSPSEMFLSAVTILEVERGILLVGRRDPAQAAVLQRWLDTKLLDRYGGRILPVDVTVARQAAAFFVPDPAPERHALIAATAKVHGLVLATRNVSDFASTGVEIVNPWA